MQGKPTLARARDADEIAVEGSGPEDTAQALLASQAAAPADQVKDQNDDRNDDQKVDQTAADMEAETQEPQNQQNDKNCPEHNFPFRAASARTQGSIPGAREVS
jgi:hypothetical protein